MVTGWLGALLSILGTPAAAQGHTFDLTIAFAKSHRGLQVSGVKRSSCGLSGQAGSSVQSAAIAAPFPFSSIGSGWRADPPTAPLTVRLRVSGNKKEWSEWLAVSGEGALALPDEQRTVGKPLATGSAGFVQYRMEWSAPSCVREFTLTFLTREEVPGSKPPTR